MIDLDLYLYYIIYTIDMKISLFYRNIPHFTNHNQFLRTESTQHPRATCCIRCPSMT